MREQLKQMGNKGYYSINSHALTLTDAGSPAPLGAAQQAQLSADRTVIMEAINEVPQHRVLVLNKNWQAVNIVGVKRAFSLLWQDHARVINTHSGDFAPLDAAGWIDHSASVEEGPELHFIHTVRLSILVPKVMLLRTYDRLPVSEIKFNRENIFIRDNYTCQYSGKRCKPSDLTLDHVIPRERGGRTSWENIVTCRRDINSLKANRLPHEAGLRLIRKPIRPKWRPFSAVVAASEVDQDWQHFLPMDRKGS